MLSRSESLVQEVLSGDKSSLDRLISKVENRDKDLSEIMSLLYPRTGKAQVLGVAGLSGTWVDRMIELYRKQGKRVAILAVDSDRSQKYLSDEKVYIHFHCSRGKQGGLSRATRELIQVLDSAQFDVILVRTPGVSSLELDLLKLTQTVIVVQSAGVALKEVADVSATLPSNDLDVSELSIELMNEVEKHQAFLTKSGRREAKRLEWLRDEVAEILSERLSLSISHQFETSSGKDVLQQLLSGEMNPYQAADLISGN